MDAACTLVVALAVVPGQVAGAACTLMVVLVQLSLVHAAAAV